MADTKATQFDFLLSGLIDPATNEPLAGGSVEFYAAGTTTPKNIWTDIEKTNPFTSRTLDSSGGVQVYGDGIYKLIVKDSLGATVYTWDDIRCESGVLAFKTITSTSYTATVDDDFIIADTTAAGAAITIHLPSTSTVLRPLTVKRRGAFTVTLDAFSTQTINQTLTYALSYNGLVVTALPFGSNWEVMTPSSFGGVVSAKNFIRTADDTPVNESNTGAVTVTSANIILAVLDITGALAGDRFIVAGQYEGTKGGTGGMNRIRMLASSANIAYQDGSTIAIEDADVVASYTEHQRVSAVAICAVSGSYTITLSAQSVGSDTSVAIGAATISALQIKWGDVS
jgi:hypothetical protein